MGKWRVEDIPPLDGRTAVVTGANSGLGFETALALAGRGARVILACRSEARGAAAMQRIREAHPDAALAFAPLDLADLDSVRALAEALPDEPLDWLINNAGVMALPRGLTAQGHELQFGVNHLGHFALTGLLLPRLAASPSPRIVNVSSPAHRMGAIWFDDLNGARRYWRWLAYGQSKLANLLFTYEASRRLAATHPHVLSVAAHPGYASTHLQTRASSEAGNWLASAILAIGNRLLTQTAAMGALPTLYAATSPAVGTGEYFGPRGIGELWGYPRRVGSSRSSRNVEVASRLWSVSQELTGVRYLDV